jgi:hypothetical protein
MYELIIDKTVQEATDLLPSIMFPAGVIVNGVHQSRFGYTYISFTSTMYNEYGTYEHVWRLFPQNIQWKLVRKICHDELLL